MKCSNTILVCLLASITVSTVHCVKKCCPKNVYSKTQERCDDDTPIVLPKCAGHQSTLNNAWTFMTSYIIRNDSQGEYLDDYFGGFIVRSPNFCLVDWKSRYHSKIQEIAVICRTQRIYYSEMKSQIDESNNPDYYISYWIDISTLLHLLAMLLFAVTFYIYYLLIPTRQIEDNCLLHFAGCSCMSHAAFLYDTFNSHGLLPDICITQLYVMYFFVLSHIAWYGLFMYSVWKKFKSGLVLDDSAVQKKLQMVGYGGPAALIILANIHAHLNKLYTEFSFEQDCIVHQILIVDVYVFGPILLAIGLNCFCWQDLRTHVKTTSVKTVEDELNKQKLKSLLTLNRRLFFMLGLPWLIYVIIDGMAQILDTEIIYFLFVFMEYVFNIGAVSIPVILVMSRARVWKCVIHKYKNFQLLQIWQPSDEEETSIQSDNNSSNVPKTFPSEV